MINFSDVRSLSNYKVYNTDKDRVVTPDVLDQERDPLAFSTTGADSMLSTFDATKAAETIKERLTKVIDEYPDATKDTVISFLFDFRGGMRGRPIMVFSAIAGLLAKELDTLGFKHEILGHTTNEWKVPFEHAAQMRAEREASGRHVPAGRVGSLLHIIWKEIDGRTDKLAATMLNLAQRGLLKENVDGEAVEWAYTRMVNRSEPHKLLLTVKYGGLDPISDTTRTHNGANTGILHRHLLDTVTAINAEGNVQLSAVILEHYQAPGLFKAEQNISNEEVVKAYGDVYATASADWDDVTDTMLEAVCNSLRRSFELNHASAPTI